MQCSVVVSLAKANHMATKARVSMKQNFPRAWNQGDMNPLEDIIVQPTTIATAIFLLGCWSFILLVGVLYIVWILIL